MKKTYIACYLLFFFFCSHGQQQDDIGTRESKIEYEIDAAFPQPAENYSLPRHGNINVQLNNKPLYSANIHNGKLNGAWQSWYQNGILCDSGRLEKGLPDGVWKHWDTHGNLITLRSYSADKYGRIKNEMLRYHPRRIAFPLTVLYQQNKHAALKYMDVSYSFSSAKKTETVRRFPELIVKNITPGNGYQPVFDHILHHGPYLNFFPDGSVRDSGYYHNGLKQGLWIHRDTARNIIFKGSYANGTKVKEWKAYDASGKLKEILFYTPERRIKMEKTISEKPGRLNLFKEELLLFQTTIPGWVFFCTLLNLKTKDTTYFFDRL